MTLDDLIAYGANTEEGMQRCLDNEELYLRLVKSVAEDATFDALEAALRNNDLDAAFEAAHSLKGVLANLALTPLLAPVQEITELLRARTDMDYSPLLGSILEERDRFVALCAT